MRVLDVASRSDDVNVVRLHAGYWVLANKGRAT